VSLFRPQVFEHQTDRLYGDVHIVLPGSWQMIGYLLLACLVIGGSFLALASFSRVETAIGTIAPSSGLVTIVATRAGVISALLVENETRVSRGFPLVSVNSEELGVSGVSRQKKIADAVFIREKLVSTRADALREAAHAQRTRDEETSAGIKRELSSIEKQIAMQQSLVASSEHDVVRSRELSEKGFLSKLDLQNRVEALTLRQQQLANLEQQKISKTSAIIEVKHNLAKNEEDLTAQLAALESSLAEMEQSLIGNETSGAYSLASPIAGHVAALDIHVGQTVEAGRALMSIAPEAESLRAELYVSSDAMGFIAAGQTIRIAVDAFPYQRYGTLAAHISTVPTAPMMRPDASGALKQTYLVTAELPSTHIMAFGASQPLLPGMTLSARIVVRRESLFRWLFEPLFAVQKR
jgi:membrane fusion protein